MPVLEKCAFFSCVQCAYCGYLILGGSAKELSDEKRRHAIECKATKGSVGGTEIHGNGGSSYKRIYVTCRCYMDGEVSITVRDEGRGFDNSAVLDQTFQENLLFTHGRGIYLMKTLMDEVSFEEGGSPPNNSQSYGSAGLVPGVPVIPMRARGRDECFFKARLIRRRR